jgi:hypothetical protein
MSHKCYLRTIPPLELRIPRYCRALDAQTSANWWMLRRAICNIMVLAESLVLRRGHEMPRSPAGSPAGSPKAKEKRIVRVTYRENIIVQLLDITLTTA